MKEKICPSCRVFKNPDIFVHPKCVSKPICISCNEKFEFLEAKRNSGKRLKTGVKTQKKYKEDTFQTPEEYEIEFIKQDQ